MDPHKERIDSVVYFSIWQCIRAASTTPFMRLDNYDETRRMETFSSGN